MHLAKNSLYISKEVSACSQDRGANLFFFNTKSLSLQVMCRRLQHARISMLWRTKIMENVKYLMHFSCLTLTDIDDSFEKAFFTMES